MKKEIGKSHVSVQFDESSTSKSIARDMRELTVSAILISSIPNLTKEQTEAIISGSGEILKSIKDGLSL